MRKSEKINTLQGENSDTIFVYEYSIKETKDILSSVRKSIENTRSQAGILLGFIFLGFPSLVSFILPLSQFFKIIIIILLIIIMCLLIDSFILTKINDGVRMEKNFEKDWADKKNEFLRKYNSVLRKNIEEQKILLTRIIKNIKVSVILLSSIILFILLTQIIIC